MPPGLKLDLADGQRWLIRPVDDKAAVIVAELGKAMRLGPGEVGRELSVAVSSEPDLSDRGDSEADNAVVCRCADPTDRDVQVFYMERIAALIAREALARGGLLLHGALAEHLGSGFVMAGPGTIGKSTASRRLPPSWRSLCDDMTLIVRDGNGRFWAHPWPTWSLFHLGGPGGSWAVEHAEPCRAIFFLGRSPSDQLGPVNTTQATAMTLESAVDLARAAAQLTEENAVRTLSGEGVRAARALAAAVPAYSLKLSLDGRFWEEIELVLPVGDFPEPSERGRERGPAPEESFIARDSLPLVYTGTSMNPTLVEPDLLQVRPYGAGRARPGDIVCFKSPEVDITVVHRVVSVGRRKSGDGGPTEDIRTRGDNSASNDTWVLHAGNIIGRVTAAQRGARRREIAGGWPGLVRFGCVRLGQGVRRRAGVVPHKLYNLAAGFGFFGRLLPSSLRPRLVRFDARSRVFLKLLMGRRTVGQYDDRCKEWRIRRPFRLFVDEQAIGRAAALSRQP